MCVLSDAALFVLLLKGFSSSKEELSLVLNVSRELIKSPHATPAIPTPIEKASHTHELDIYGGVIEFFLSGLISCWG